MPFKFFNSFVQPVFLLLLKQDIASIENILHVRHRISFRRLAIFQFGNLIH